VQVELEQEEEEGEDDEEVEEDEEEGREVLEVGEGQHSLLEKNCQGQLSRQSASSSADCAQFVEALG
jgi:hypothetical protein